jgi:hypothetical protein
VPPFQGWEPIFDVQQSAIANRQSAILP